MRIVFASLCMLMCFAVAANGAQGPRQGPQQGPPPEAFEACAGLAVDDPCMMMTPHGEMEGTCITPMDDPEAVVCLPDGAPGQDPGQQPEHQ